MPCPASDVTGTLGLSGQYVAWGQSDVMCGWLLSNVCMWSSASSGSGFHLHSLATHLMAVNSWNVYAGGVREKGMAQSHSFPEVEEGGKNAHTWLLQDQEGCETKRGLDST